MQDKRVLVVGCGKIGLRVAEALSEDFTVWGLRRSHLPDTASIRYISADVCQPEALQQRLHDKLSGGLDYIIYCLTPSERTEQAYQQTYRVGLENLIRALPNKARLQRIIFISSSSVYHQDDDQWVDELSSCEPNSYSGQTILAAEHFLQDSGLPSTVIRFSGIYGGQRRQLIRQVQNSAEQDQAIISRSLRRSNRIHEDDCVGFIVHIIQKAAKNQTLESLYLASDDLPVDLNEVVQWIATEMGIEISTKVSDELKRRSGNKQCTNQRLRDSGYQLRYPSYQEGYRAMLNDMQTRQ